ncbi:MAG: hypothetical protein K8R21_06095 [Leptospira sp.]|nr:hypothetical protein [Leptospira sp.]
MIRAIEMGVPLIRPTLDGVSGAVDEFGIEIIKPTEIGEETYRIFEIKTGGIITFYRIAGDLPLHILNLLIFAAGFVRFLYVRRHRDHI